MNNDNRDLFDFSKFHRYEETESLDPNRSRKVTLRATETEKTALVNPTASLKPTDQWEKVNSVISSARNQKDNQDDVNEETNQFRTISSLHSSPKIANKDINLEEDNNEFEPPRKLVAKEKAKKLKSKKSAATEILTFLLPTFIALLIALGLRGFVFTNTTVPTGSMLNTIEIGSRLIGSKLSYSFGQDPERYDIVIFKYPDNEKQEYVKRVIGLPGETVEIIDGKVYINGSKTPLKDNFVTTGTPKGNYGPYKVPKGCYFMLGDNRSNSNDSRFWENQFVKEEKIIAKVVFQYYPSFEKIK